MRSACVSVIFVALVTNVETSNKTTLHVGILLELTEYSNKYFIEVFDDMLNYTLQRIANRSDILDGFDFQVCVKDTKVSKHLKCTLLYDETI